jgi:hypothetical protein
MEALQQEGMSADGARKTVEELSQGIPWETIAAGGTTLVSAGGTGASAGHAAADPPGRHAADALSASDLDTLKKVGTRLTAVGTVSTGALALHDVFVNDAPAGETTGKVVGSLAGGYVAGVGAWALAGTAVGPGGAIALGLVGAVVLGIAGEKVGGAVGSVFDR